MRDPGVILRKKRGRTGKNKAFLFGQDSSRATGMGRSQIAVTFRSLYYDASESSIFFGLSQPERACTPGWGFGRDTISGAVQRR